MKQKKPVPSKQEIAAQLASMAESFELSAQALDAKDTEYDRSFAAAARRVAARYRARAERMRSEHQA